MILDVKNILCNSKLQNVVYDFCVKDGIRI